MFFGFFGHNKKIALKTHHKKILNNLMINDTTPGTVLHDFQVLLDVLQENEHKLTGKNQLKLNTVHEINTRLHAPLDVRLQRQTQKSYPPIEGLYLLLRASGLSYIHNKGRTAIIRIDDAQWMEQWNAFNPTEKYCHLLEAWVLRGFEELIGGRPLNISVPRIFDKILSGYNMIGDTGYKIESYQHFRDEFNFYPETYNLALMALFGMVKLHPGDPVDGDGWQLKKVERTEIGEAVLALLSDILLEQLPKQMQELEDMVQQTLELDGDLDDMQSQDNPVSPETKSRSTSFLHHSMQDYFPAWQKTMEFIRPDDAKGHITFEVSLGREWSAEIILDAAQLFDTLARAILTAVKFDSDHLYQFVYQSRFGRESQIVHPYVDGFFTTDEVTLGSIGMREGLRMTFIFDFGDWWEFGLIVKKRELDKTGVKIEIKNIKGDAPEQYPEWDNDYGDDDFESFATGFDFF